MPWRTLLAALLIVPALSWAQEREPEVIEFIPAEGVDWGIRNVGAMLSAPFGMWGYWYKEPSVVIDTVPAESRLELFYIRSNFQKLFLRAAPPVKLLLPSRIMSTDRDALTIRVASAGFKSAEYTFPVTKVPEKLVLELKPLPNSLVFVGHTHLANRTTLTLRTEKEPEFRVFRARGGNGFTLSLRETADKLDDHTPISGGHVKLLEVSQVGEDILLRIETAQADTEVRSKQSYDPIRKEHVFLLDLMDEGGRAPSMRQVREELERLPIALGGPCLEAFADALRSGLEPEVIARAHRPSGSIADLYRREAMLRLGRLDRGSVRTRSGQTLRTGDPLELEMALQSAAEVEGYLGLLGAFARREAEPATVLRSLVAPELTADAFSPVYAAAEAAHLACREGSAN